MLASHLMQFESNLMIDIRHSEVEGISMRGSDLSQQNNKSIVEQEKVREVKLQPFKMKVLLS